MINPNKLRFNYTTETLYARSLMLTTVIDPQRFMNRFWKYTYSGMKAANKRRSAATSEMDRVGARSLIMWVLQRYCLLLLVAVIAKPGNVAGI